MDNDRTVSLQEIEEAAIRPVGRSGRRFWILVGLLGLLAGWALAAYVVQLISGLAAAGYSDTAFWGIYEANLVAFIGVSYGGALVSAILRLTHARWRAPITRMAEAMAVVSLLVGALFAIVHVGRPERLWRIIFAPQVSSPILWDFVAIVSYLLATLIFLYLPLIPDLAVLRDRMRRPAAPSPGPDAAAGGWRGHVYGLLALNWRGLPEQQRLLESAMTMVAIMIIPLAVVVHSVLSWAFAMTGRPGWDSTIFAPYFVVAALYSGVGMVILVIAGFRRGYGLHKFITPQHFRYLAYLLLTLSAVYLYFTFTELFTEGYVRSEEITPLVAALLVGQYAPFFWLFVVAGGVLPLLIIAIPRTRTVPGIVIASALVVSGMWLKRLLIVVPPATSPLIRQAGATWGAFHPTWVSIGITLGSAAAIPLLLMILFKFIPILAIHEMATAGAAERETVPALPVAPGTLQQEGGVAR